MNQINTILDEKSYIKNHFVNTYTWLFVALATMMATSIVVANNLTPTIVKALFNPITLFVFLVAQIGLIVLLQKQTITSIDQSRKKEEIKIGPAAIALIAFAVIQGIFFTTILYSYSTTVITNAFLAASLTFGSAALVGYLIKTDLAPAARVAYMAFMAVILYSFTLYLLGLFGIKLYSATTDLILSYVIIVIFSVFTAYDNQKMKEHAVWGYHENIDVRVLAISYSLSLFLNFLNILMAFIRIFGRRD